MEVIIAARRSQIAKGYTQTGIESQDEDARDWAEAEGHNVVATVPDTASGKKAMWDRKNLRPWVTDARLMARYQGIVAAKQDRLSRADWQDEEALRAWAVANGKTLFIVDKDLRWPPRDDPRFHDDDVAAWHRGAEEAHREWTTDSRRYKRMHRNLLDNNYLNTRRPYGYRIYGVNCGESPCRCSEKKLEDHKTLIIYEPEAKYIREAARRYLGGESLTAICDDFNTREGQRWNFQTLAKRLRSPAIAGRRGKLRYPEIISWLDHEALEKRLDERANRQGSSPTNAYMLTGLVRDDAGHPMHGHVSKGWVNVIRYYRCRRGCGFMVRMDKADDEVGRQITALYGQAWAMELRTEPGQNNFDRIARLRAERNDLDDMSEDYEDRHAELTAEIRRLVKEDQEHPNPDKPKWVLTGKTVAQEWEAKNRVGRRDWLKANGFEIIAHRNGKIEVVPGPIYGLGEGIGPIEVPDFPHIQIDVE
jgi:Resolvase, N terminal domain/Recombinase